MLEFPVLEPLYQKYVNASCYFIYLLQLLIGLRIKHHSVHAHHWGLPLGSRISLTISSVAPSNVKTTLESSAVLDALILTTNLGG